VPWELIGVAGEEELAAAGLTVRCLQCDDGSLPESDDDADALAYIARAY
jgi:prolyl-tRNA synthetase